MNKNYITTTSNIDSPFEGYYSMDAFDFADCTGDYIPISYETVQSLLTDEDKDFIDASRIQAQTSKVEQHLSSYFDTKPFAAKTALAKQNHFSKLYYAQQ